MAKNQTTTDTDKGADHLLGQLEEGEVGVEAGLFDQEMAKIGAYNEFGTKDIPSRPFIRTTSDTKRAQWDAYMDRQLNLMAQGKRKIEFALAHLGAQMEEDIKKTITDWKTPKNAPATIAEKGTDNPLIDTGKMRNSVSFRVVT